MKGQQKYGFDRWMEQVDAAAKAACGMSIHDLPDVCFRDMYDDGDTPKQAAKAAIRAARDE